MGNANSMKFHQSTVWSCWGRVLSEHAHCSAFICYTSDISFCVCPPPHQHNFWSGLLLLLWMRPLRVLTCGVITLFINNDKTLPQNNKRPTENNRWNALKGSFLKRQTHIYHPTPKRHIYTHIYIHKHKASADKTKTLTFGWTNRLKYSKTKKGGSNFFQLCRHCNADYRYCHHYHHFSFSFIWIYRHKFGLGSW